MKKKAPSKRNPMAGALQSPQFAPKVTPTKASKQDKTDPWSKKAKHKNKVEESTKPQSLAEFYQVGDKVEITGGPVKSILDRSEELLKKDGDQKKKKKAKGAIEGVVRNFGPEETLGVTIDGEYHLISPDDLELIYESYHMDFQDLAEWSYAKMTSGVSVAIDSEEQSILDKCAKKMYKNNLDHREQEVARKMVSKGILHRLKDEGGVYFTDVVKKLTRF